MPAKQPQVWSVVWIAAISLLAFVVMILLVNNLPATEVIPYSDFQKYLDAGKVAKATVTGDTVTGELTEKLPSGTTSFRTNRIAPELATELSAWRPVQRHPVQQWPRRAAVMDLRVRDM